MKKPFILKDVLEKYQINDLKNAIENNLNNNVFLHEKSIGRKSFHMKDCLLMQVYLENLTVVARSIFDSESLLPTYAFFSEYSQANSYLPKHKDNNGNTYTIDLCIYTKKPWGIFIEGEEYLSDENEAVCFYGEDQEHWRDPLGENNCVGVIFFHFAEPANNYFSVQKNIAFYEQNGFVILKSNTVHPLPYYDSFFDDKTEIVYEKDQETIRSIYGFHHHDLFKRWLSGQNEIYKYVTSILGKDVYLHQSKINFKNNNTDSVWPYHRDFPFWNVFDYIVENKMINVVIYLDDVLECSGEIQFIPQSHTIFLDREQENSTTIYSLDGSASSELLFSFSEEEILNLIEKYGLVSSFGTKGSILLFNPDIIHGSKRSTSDNKRKLMILTFNSCNNLPSNRSSRPEYLCSKDYEPIRWDSIN